MSADQSVTVQPVLASSSSSSQSANDRKVMVRARLAAFVQIMQDLRFDLGVPLTVSTRSGAPPTEYNGNRIYSRFLPSSLQGPAIKRERPAPIGPIPRMIDQLKRRCTRLLLTTTPAEGATDPVHRVPVHVWLNSSDVRRLLEYWKGRSAFAAPAPVNSPAETTELIDSVAATKLSLLVWRAPVLTPAGASHVRLLKGYHVIPVTRLEATRFHHIPVEMRAGMINADLRALVDSKLDALMHAVA